MAINVAVGKGPDGKKVLLFGYETEAWADVAGMLRMLKSQFPEEWRAVHYEIGGRMSGLVIPEGASNGRSKDNAGGSVPEGGGASGEAGPAGEGA